MVTRENTVAKNYSTPEIDLNISLRISMAACYFVLSKKDLAFPQQILDWNKLPLDWKSLIEESIEDFYEKKYESEPVSNSELNRMA